jgi:hypothetical protein
MADTILDRFTIGQGKILPVDHTGPASYTTGGETVGTLNNLTGIAGVGMDSFDLILGSGNLSASGNYQVFVQQTGLGVRKTFKILWFAVTLPAGVLTLTQVANATSLAGETVRLAYVGK